MFHKGRGPRRGAGGRAGDAGAEPPEVYLIRLGGAGAFGPRRNLKNPFPLAQARGKVAAPAAGWG